MEKKPKQDKNTKKSAEMPSFAGVFGFLTFTRCVERPRAVRRAEPSRFDTIPSHQGLHPSRNTIARSSSK
jgi:hypothetical protein